MGFLLLSFNLQVLCWTPSSAFIMSLFNISFAVRDNLRVSRLQKLSKVCLSYSFDVFNLRLQLFSYLSWLSFWVNYFDGVKHLNRFYNFFLLNVLLNWRVFFEWWSWWAPALTDALTAAVNRLRFDNCYLRLGSFILFKNFNEPTRINSVLVHEVIKLDWFCNLLFSLSVQNIINFFPKCLNHFACGLFKIWNDVVSYPNSLSRMNLSHTFNIWLPWAFSSNFESLLCSVLYFEALLVFEMLSFPNLFKFNVDLFKEKQWIHDT